jgi:hypothetical protein
MAGEQGPRYGGFRRDPQTLDLFINKAGTDVAQVSSTGVAVTGALTASSLFNLGASESTVASGVLTVTTPYVNVLPESSTADTVDSIVYTGATTGTLLICTSTATNTITFDDANINLGASTRAVAPGGSITLFFDGTQWTELTFLTASDNA